MDRHKELNIGSGSSNHRLLTRRGMADLRAGRVILKPDGSASGRF